MGDSRTIINKNDMEKELALVEYPGVVKNVDKMLLTLGGLPKISQVIGGEKKKLELKFHPKNVFNKPALGECHETAGLLLKVKVRKNKTKTEEQPTHTVEVLGRCRKSIRFNSMCDYQYIPIVKNEQGEEEYLYDKIVPKGIPGQEWWSQNDTSLFLPPGVFSRTDNIPPNLFRKDHKTTTNPDILDINRTKQIESPQFQPFNLTDPFPTTPAQDVVKRMTVKYVSDKQWEIVRKLFEECPIWNRISLIYESDLTHDKMKSILPSVSYYFTSGPWRTLYCRLGYDPRKDFQSRYYQMIDFRVRCKPGVSEHIKSKTKARQVASRIEQAGGASTSQQQQQQRQDINYPYFEEGRLPRYRQCIYRYCDIKIPKIIEMLEKIPTPLSGATCNEKTGWLPPGFDDQVRQIMSGCVKEHVKNVEGRHGGDGDEDEEMDVDDLTEDDEEDEEEGDRIIDDFEHIFKEDMDYDVNA